MSKECYMDILDVEDVKNDVEYDVDVRDGESKRSRKGVRRSLKTQRDHVDFRRWAHRRKSEGEDEYERLNVELR